MIDINTVSKYILDSVEYELELNKSDIKEAIIEIVGKSLNDVDFANILLKEYKTSEKLKETIDKYPYKISEFIKRKTIMRITKNIYFESFGTSKTIRMSQKSLVKFVKHILDKYIEYIITNVVDGKEILIRGLGKLTKHSRLLGEGINPFTGLKRKAKIIRYVRFNTASSLKFKLRNSEDDNDEIY